MKPLTQTGLTEFLERFENFKGAELRSVEVINPFEIKVVLATQDKARAFDWITIELLFSEVEAANLVEDNQLNFIDMENGASIIYEENKFAFGIGECYNISTIKSSSLYLISNTLKYQEGQF
ncbi:hypothetical protein [Sulfurimonas marina]|uniref:Uncharacterized protein n=1 Tax=Sulfurimonas marina TaxID=2590551 RepID=A0A7M1AXZ0_9BACT|nr:hypothetical protein [Sulfurimonas marina]QOP42314.1 hypothetical protein FJR03_11430 [Sulfurimonas marina]